MKTYKEYVNEDTIEKKHGSPIPKSTIGVNPGKQYTCDDCSRLSECLDMFGEGIRNDTFCNWTPSRFHYIKR